ncbi:hypothetical protein EDB81DRAFT_227813 [Dactylonectria macrodidyma]|uniref:Uncharacterized protein n=1 Tax=Dactylonectria macrodidyma TaxID=307937 RepID=A0A9P9DLH3_9HYPO|nr:hypothetical protein EDB81DRAFT_227813 [Dactylonectria macrodidyma]
MTAPGTSYVVILVPFLSFRQDCSSLAHCGKTFTTTRALWVNVMLCYWDMKPSWGIMFTTADETWLGFAMRATKNSR